MAERTLTNRQLQGRLNDLEGALDDERKERLAQGAEHDEDIETHGEKLNALGETLDECQRRLKWLLRRAMLKAGRPPKKST